MKKTLNHKSEAAQHPCIADKTSSFTCDAMEMVEAAILIAIVVALGLIFKTQITNFVNNVFSGLNNGSF